MATSHLHSCAPVHGDDVLCIHSTTFLQQKIVSITEQYSLLNLEFRYRKDEWPARSSAYNEKIVRMTHYRSTKRIWRDSNGLWGVFADWSSFLLLFLRFILLSFAINLLKLWKRWRIMKLIQRNFHGSRKTQRKYLQAGITLLEFKFFNKSVHRLLTRVKRTEHFNMPGFSQCWSRHHHYSLIRICSYFFLEEIKIHRQNLMPALRPNM